MIFHPSGHAWFERIGALFDDELKGDDRNHNGMKSCDEESETRRESLVRRKGKMEAAITTDHVRKTK